ncbi:thioredoxin [Bacteroidota bacterium]
MKRIKTIIPVLLLIVSVAACGAGKNDKKETAASASVNKATISLTTDLFLKKVADFKANPSEWKYLGDKPSIIDFHADWCVYCKKLEPVLEELAKEYEGKIYIYKVDTEKEREIAAAFGIQALPTLLFIPMNDQPRVAQGAVPKEELKKYIDTILLKK